MLWPGSDSSGWLDDVAASVGIDSGSFAGGHPIESLDIALGPFVEDQGLWFDLGIDDGLPAGTGATVELISSSADEVVGRVAVAGVWVEPVTLGDRQFVRLTIPGCGYTSVAGEPQLPIVRSLLAVPEHAGVRAAISGQPQLLSMADVGIGDPLAPLQAAVPKVAGGLEAATPSYSSAAYQADRFAPTAGIRVVEAGYAAGRRLVMLEIAPVTYSPATGAARVYDTLTFHVRFEGAQPTDSTVSGGEGAQLADVSPDYPAAAATKGGQRLLIVAHDDFVADLAPFVTHKAGLGWTVELADTATAGTTNSDVRAYIRSRYDEPATRPDAVLLVGDTDRIPHFTGSGNGFPATDLYYGCMDDGDDWYPELPVGRLSVVDGGQLANVVEKTISYETATGDWTNGAAFLAGNDHFEVSEGTHNDVIDNYMDPLGYVSDKLYEQTYGATTQDVRESLNNGRALAVYSGHGSSDSWTDGPAFTQTDVRNLTNHEMYPFVASFGCNVGSYSLGECFMETWLREADGGAAVAVASSANTYWIQDDILEKKLFAAIYDEGQVGLGSAWMRAKQLYLEHFGVGDLTRGYFEMYNVLGDPTLEVLGLEFTIRSPADLPPAYVGEPYEYVLRATSGTRPYTWQVADGVLPPGLELDPTTGAIGGIPTAAGTATFTLEATDASLATDSREFHLPVAIRLEITTPGQLPTGLLNEAYSVTLEALGGTAPYRWAMLGAGEYAEGNPGSGYLGGGTAMGWQSDDETWELALPWAFPYYGAEYDSVYVCSNGFLDFASTSNDFTNSQEELLSNVRIAPLWDDLLTRDGDIYVTETGDYVAIRWDGRTLWPVSDVDFEAVLYRNGDVQFNYGSEHSGLSPTIGLSNGDGVNYTLSSLDGTSLIPDFVSSRFTHGGLLPVGLSLDTVTGQISGAPTEQGIFDLSVRVRDSGTPQQTDIGSFTLEVLDLPPSVSIGDVVFNPEGDTGTRDAVFLVNLSFAVGQTVTVEYGTADGTALAGQDYVATSGTLTFAPGQVQRTLSVPVIGDRVDEEDESFFADLVSAVFASIGNGRGEGTIIDDDTEVTGRYVFYNNSAWDGNDPAANPLDDAAIATDKVVLMPGETATFDHYTGYSRGINGIMIDIGDLPVGATPGIGDFRFHAGNSDEPSLWEAVPAMPSVTVRPDAGVDGSDRVTLVWEDNAIQKQWLQVTVLATGNTGLVENDVFYFGNAIGESGDSTTDAKVNAFDMLGARDNQRSFLHPATVDFDYDYNRDQRVNGYDMLIARDNQTHFLNALELITVPASKAGGGGESPDSTPVVEDCPPPTGKPEAGNKPTRIEAVSVRDAVFEEAAGSKWAGGEAAFGKLDWLFEFEQTASRDHRVGKHFRGVMGGVVSPNGDCDF